MALQLTPTEYKGDPVESMVPRFSASVSSDGKVLEILAYGEIVDDGTITRLEAWGTPTDGFISAGAIKRAIDEAGEYDSIALRINSPGGDAFEGIAAYNILRSQGKPIACYIDSIAASSASILAMAGDTITMGVNCLMMIHNAWCCCCGYASDMRKQADVLDTVSSAIGNTYVQKTGQSAEAIKSLMDSETWMTAEEAVAGGFATKIAENPAEQSAMAMARGFKALASMKHVPDALKSSATETPLDGVRPAVLPVAASIRPKAENAGGCDCTCDNCIANNCDQCSNLLCTDQNCIDCPMQGTEANANLAAYEARAWVLLHGSTNTVSSQA